MKTQQQTMRQSKNDTMKKYRIKQPHEEFGKSDKMPWNRNSAKEVHSSNTGRENAYFHKQHIKRSDYLLTIYGKQNQINNKGKKVVHVDLSLDTINNFEKEEDPIESKHILNTNVKYNISNKSPPMKNNSTACKLNPYDILPPRISIKMDSLSNRIDNLLSTLHKRDIKRNIEKSGRSIKREGST
jgi:hypothetical protein